MSDAGPAVGPLSQDERLELEQLRAQLAAQQQTSSTPARSDRGRTWPKTIAAALVIVVGCALAPLAVAALWASGQVGDTDRYVETIAPLADDPALQAQVTEDITNEIFSRLEIDTLMSRLVAALGDQLPVDVAQQLDALSGPLAAGIRSTAEGQIARIVESETFALAWAEANRAAHSALNAALSGDDTGSLQVQNGTVTVDLSEFAAAVKARLAATGFALAERIPEINASFVILQSDNLDRVQRAYDLLRTLGFWLGPISAAMIGLGIFLARNHRRASIAAGLGVAAVMLASGIALFLARAAYLDGIPPEVLSDEAARSVFDTGVRFLREVIRAAGLMGLLLAAGAFLTGSSVTATRTRAGATRAGEVTHNWLGSMGLPMQRLGQPVRTRSSLWRIALVVLVIVALVLPTYPTPALVIWSAVGLVVGLFVVQVLASPDPATATNDPAADGS